MEERITTLERRFVLLLRARELWVPASEKLRSLPRLSAGLHCLQVPECPEGGDVSP